MTLSYQSSKLVGQISLDWLAAFSVVRIISAVWFDICYNDKGQENYEDSMGLGACTEALNLLYASGFPPKAFITMPDIS